MQLVIAEKPSVAQTIAKVLGANQRKGGYIEGNGYIISWCVGHLVGLANPESYGEQYKTWSFDNLPIIPESYKFAVNAKTKEQYDILKKLMSDSRVDELICATDAGREGECIFRYVYNMAKCNKPFKRLWTSSLEESAIREGFANLKDSSEYDNLFSAGFCRAKADWLVGMNASRLFSLRYNAHLNITFSIFTRKRRIRNQHSLYSAISLYRKRASLIFMMTYGISLLQWAFRKNKLRLFTTRTQKPRKRSFSRRYAAEKSVL